MVPVRDLTSDRLEGDGPRIVLLHAGVADRRCWRDVAPALHKRGADVLAPDRRGFGETPASEEPFRHVDDLIALLDEPAWLVGNSMGGEIAIDAALLRPDLVAGLVLIAPAVSGAPEPPTDSLEPATRQIVRSLEAAGAAGDLDALNRHLLHLWLDGPGQQEGRVGGEVRELAADMSLAALRSGADEDAGASDVDAWQRLEEVTPPATIVWGELDLEEIAVACRELERRLADVRAVRVLPGVAHLPSLERPDLVVEIIAEAVGLA